MVNIVRIWTDSMKFLLWRLNESISSFGELDSLFGLVACMVAIDMECYYSVYIHRNCRRSCGVSEIVVFATFDTYSYS